MNHQLADGLCIKITLEVDEDAWMQALMDPNQAAEVEAGLERAESEVKRVLKQWRKSKRKADKLRDEAPGKMGETS